VRASRKATHCRRGHAKADFFRWVAGKMRCSACYKSSSVREKERRTYIARCLAEGVNLGPPKWTWQDYADQCDREFSTPHFLRKAPEILDYLQRHKVKP
jgi:hypothetical protein